MVVKEAITNKHRKIRSGLMSEVGKLLRGYKEQLEILTSALEDIKALPFKSDKPYELMDAVEIAMKALKESANITKDN